MKRLLAILLAAAAGACVVLAQQSGIGGGNGGAIYPLDSSVTVQTNGGGTSYGISSSGAATNGIPKLNGYGTNTTLYGAAISNATTVNATGTVSAWHFANVVSTLNILDFGAVPNNGSDQTAAIQAAINAAGTNNAVPTNSTRVFVPAGKFTISGTLYLTNGVVLEGEGASYSSGGSWLHKSGSGSAIVPTSGRCNVRNLYFDGSSSSDAISCTNTAGTTQMSIENCRFYAFNHAILLSVAWNVDVLRCYATGCGYGLFCSNQVNRINVLGGAYSSNTNGITITGGSCFTYLIAADIEGNVTALATDQSAVNVTLMGAQLEGNTNSVCATNAINLKLDHCTLESSGTNVWLIGCQNPEIDGGYMVGAQNFYVDSGTSGLFINSPYIATQTYADFNQAVSCFTLRTNAVLTGGTFTGNGLGLTNISLYINTNAFGQVLSGGQWNRTNLTANVTVTGISGLDLTRGCSTYLVATNPTASTTYTVTFPAACKGGGTNAVMGPVYAIAGSTVWEFQLNSDAYGTNVNASPH